LLLRLSLKEPSLELLSNNIHIKRIMSISYQLLRVRTESCT
jgi:hypothetical protein